MEKDKRDILENFLNELNKKKEEPLAFTLSSPDIAANVKKWLSTGVLAIDRAIGQGIPSGRMTEIYGDFASGKTLLAMQLVREAQKAGYLSVVVDTEASFSVDMAKNIDVELDKVIYLSPESIEEVFDSIEKILDVQSQNALNVPVLVVWDSVAATPCVHEIENPVGTPEMGLRARLISQGLRKIVSRVAKQDVFLFFVNQIRESMDAFGEKFFTPGGKAVKFHASVRLFIKAGEVIKEGDKVIGKRGKIKVTKNKVYPPFKEVEFEMYFDKGIPKHSGLAKFLANEGVITQKGGGWYEYKDISFRAEEIGKIEHLIFQKQGEKND